jgi:hypothetical protein
MASKQVSKCGVHLVVAEALSENHHERIVRHLDSMNVTLSRPLHQMGWRNTHNECPECVEGSQPS